MLKRYVVDSQQSRFTVQAFATGLLAGFGHSPKFAVRQFEGSLAFSPDAGANSSFELNVKSSSLELITAMNETEHEEIQRVTLHEVLEVDKYPQISFYGADLAPTQIADGWFRIVMRGEMKLHGFAKTIDIDSQFRLGGASARLSGAFSLSLTDFKIKRVKSVGGLLKVKDELKFDFDLLALERGHP
jgi:polyisoprenoid-binding protein YceI